MKRGGVFGALAIGAGSLLVAMGLLAVAGCDTDTLPVDCLCTEEFRSFTVTVIDGTGASVDNMDVAVTRTRDGFAFPPGQDLGFAAGVYVILDDGSKDTIGPGGEAVRVVATKDGTSVTGDYVFAADDCLCHIEKLSGPDTLVWGVGS
jgi:hypothetical protein